MTLDYFSPVAEFLPLLHTWSLAVEEQFYIVFPLLLILLYRLPKGVVIGALGTIFVCSLVLSVHTVEHYPTAAFYLLPSRAWELAIGSYLAISNLRSLQLRWLKETIATFAVLLITLPVVLYSDDTPFPGLAALAPCIGTGLLIYLGIHGDTWVNRILSRRPLVWFGLISYSLYLWHWPVLAFLRGYLSKVDIGTGFAALAILLSIAVATLSQRFIEAPFRRRSFLSRERLLGLAAGVLTVTAAVGMAGWLTDGASFRLDEKTLALANAKSDIDPRRKSCFGVAPGEDLCRIGSQLSSPPSFLLWGDSHAAALMPAVSVAAEKARRSGLFVGTSACPPLLGVWRPMQANGENCRDFNDAVIHYLETNGDQISLVIIQGRWALSATGERAPLESGSNPLIADNSSEQFTRSDNVLVFERGLRRTIQTLLGLNKTVVMLGGVPEIGWDVPVTLARGQYTGNFTAIPPNIDDFQARNASVHRVTSKLARELEFEYVPIADIICDDVCRVLHDGRPVYVDDDHLSLYGAMNLVGPRLVERIWPTY